MFDFNQVPLLREYVRVIRLPIISLDALFLACGIVLSILYRNLLTFPIRYASFRTITLDKIEFDVYY